MALACSAEGEIRGNAPEGGRRYEDEPEDDGPDLAQTIDNYPFIDGGGGVHFQRS